jgi:hypothetical protein
MISIFLSYSSNDKSLARQIAKDLRREGFEVWFDEWKIFVGHSISQKIEKGLEEADFVAVLLTNYSVNSGWVEKEWQSKIGEEADNKKVLILPLLGEDCRIPLLLKDKKYADFREQYNLGITELIVAINIHSKVEESIPDGNGSEKLERLSELPLGIPTPCFFPSISSAAKNALTPLSHLKMLVTLRYPQFLISAFDIFNAKRESRDEMLKILEKAFLQGQIILIDSGMYEKKWLRARSWPKKNFYSTLRLTTFFHYSFSYDNLKPQEDPKETASSIIRFVIKDRKEGDLNAIIPIIHANKFEEFPVISAEIATNLDSLMVAVPERELGDGVLAIAENIRSIREALNRTGQYRLLHILGTGNPLSILIYAACGADSFDGLDWCQTVADHPTGRLHHWLQLDFFAEQSRFGSDNELPYIIRTFSHNLLFYKSWMQMIQDAIKNKVIGKMICDFIPATVHEKVMETIQ